MKLSPPDRVGYRFYLFLRFSSHLFFKEILEIQRDRPSYTGTKYLTLDIMPGQIAAQVTQRE